jgi:hypothetical protein
MGKLRQIRETVRQALTAEPWPSGLERLDGLPPKQLMGPLFAMLLEQDALVARRAASAFGPVVARLFSQKPEDARQLVRQLMWRLNEESGNVGWGAPEAFGEILAAEPVLAREFHRVLASYINERDCETGDNYLELCPLRKGVYRALARLAEVRPELVLPARGDLAKALAEPDPESRGLAALALGGLLPLAGGDAPAITRALQALAADQTPFDLYRQGFLTPSTVGGAVAMALKKSP